MRAELSAAGLLPGMLVRVNVPLGKPAMVTVVPPTAVRRDAFGASVFILQDVEENGERKTRARKRAVQLATVGDADQSSDWVVVSEGLQPGERIAAIGAFKLNDGSLVVASAPNEDAKLRLVGN